MFPVIEENIENLSDNKVATKNDQEFILVLEKQIAANHIKIRERIIRKKNSLIEYSILEG
jgi:hypothetical protein